MNKPSFPIPFFWVDEVMPVLGPEEFALLMYASRYLWSDKPLGDRISDTEFCYIGDLCGMSHRRFRKALQTLVRAGLLVESEGYYRLYEGEESVDLERIRAATETA